MAIVATGAAILLACGGAPAETYSPGFSGGDKFTPVLGGTGGGTFQARCPEGSFLVGLEVTQDSRIKSVKPLCATLEGDRLGTPQRSPLEFGSPNANRYSRVCPGGGSPNAIYVSADGNHLIGVYEIALRCANSRGELPIGDATYIRFAGMAQSDSLFSKPKHADGSAECQAGYISKGVLGRYGTFIDAIGLICGWPGPPGVSGARAPAPPAAVGAAPAARANPDTCKSGYVWRDARRGDHVCVIPATREQAAADNAAAAARWGSSANHYCKPGFVWREAFAGDDVCVTVAIRSQAAQDNAAAKGHRFAP